MNKKSRRDCYLLLHVQPDAPTELIKESYRTLMLKLRYHPDLGGDSSDASLIDEAYAVLTDAEKRETYNRERRGSETRVGLSTRAPAKPAPLKPASKPVTPQPTQVVLSARPEPADPYICVFYENTNCTGYQPAKEVCRVCDAPLKLIDFITGDANGARHAAHRL